MRALGAATALALLALAASGCAAIEPSATAAPPSGTALAKAGNTTATTPATAPPAPYVLTADEQRLSCRKLTGRMQVRILQIRDSGERHKPSATAQALQSSTVPILGGSTRGADVEADVARDRSMLEAYNRQLAAKGCKSFDLEAELKPKPASATPTPTLTAPATAPRSAR